MDDPSPTLSLGSLFLVLLAFLRAVGLVKRRVCVAVGVSWEGEGSGHDALGFHYGCEFLLGAEKGQGRVNLSLLSLSLSLSCCLQCCLRPPLLEI